MAPIAKIGTYGFTTKNYTLRARAE